MTRSEITKKPEDQGFLDTIVSLVTSGDRLLEGEENDRINILLMGIGGKGHDGPELTDTIIFGSLKPSTKELGMMSIPRDLAIPIPGYGYRKINHTNYFGETKNEGQGGKYATKVIGNLIDQDIQYYLKIDFKGFEDFIDNLGGIDIYVENTFYDSKYPTWDHKVQTISFKEGWQHMDGETALQYSRSRHGSNGEGSDFARSRRQQKVLLAVKDNLFSTKTILNPKRISALIDTVKDNIETNLTTWEILKLAKLAKDIDQNTINNHVLTPGPNQPFYETNLNGAYVILPDNDDWSAMQQIATNIFSETPSYQPITPSMKPQETFVRIRIENGTAVNGLAFRTSQLLEGQGFKVTSVANATTRDWDHTMIYDLTEGKKEEELKALQNYLKADIATTASGWIFTDNITPKKISLTDEGIKSGAQSENIDFLVILGQNSANLVRR